MLSIIIPTLNEEECLPLLLREIEKQNFKDYEIIISDSDSRDGTLEIAKNHGCKIASGGNSPAGARNRGAEISQGELFLFLDADIIFLPPKFLEKLLREFRDRNLGVVSFTICPKGNILDKIAYGLYNFWVNITQKFLAHASEAVLVKKEIHQKVGGFDETIKIGEDHDYARRAAKFGKFGFIKTGTALTSSRRFERYGRIRTYLKYLLAGVYMIFFGPVRSDIFKYKFDHLIKDSEDRKK